MSILDKIVKDKYKEIELKKRLIPVSQLEKSVLFERDCYSLIQNLKKSASGIIAEHKRRSPSKSVINHSYNCFDVVESYEKSGVSGISILTDGKYFGGSLDDLLVSRASCQLPLLRKDFMIDPYQIYEAKAYGADVILLIAAVLKRSKIQEFASLAKSLGLEVLLEVHNQEELEKSLMPELDLLGVNNRDLTTFEVSLKTSEKLSEKIPNDFVKISESGISDTASIIHLRKFGYQGFLIGENFMKTDTIEKATKEFITQLETQY